MPVFSRLRPFIKTFQGLDCDGYWLTHDVNITYLTGFQAEESWLLVFPEKSFYITDARYTLAARRGLTGVCVREYSVSPVPVFWDCIAEMKAGRIGFDPRHISLALYQRVRQKARPGVRLVPGDSLVERMREIKSAEEVRKIRGALRLHREALEYLKRVIRPGRTERDFSQAGGLCPGARGGFFFSSHSGLRPEFLFSACQSDGPAHPSS
jgi:Xaa-Pro aminopeptidase